MFYRLLYINCNVVAPPPRVGAVVKLSGRYEINTLSFSFLISFFRLNIKDLPGDTHESFLKKFFDMAQKINSRKNSRGTMDATLYFATEKDAADAFRKAMRSTINGNPINMLPQQRRAEGGDGDDDAEGTKGNQKMSLSEFDPRYYIRRILQIRKLKKNYSKSYLEKFFKDGKLTDYKDNGK